MDDKDLLVFIPTYNESENVRLIIEGLRYNLGRVPILFCDDNSPDGTFELIQSIAREDGFIDVIHRESKLGIGSAHKVGIREASRRGYLQESYNRAKELLIQTWTPETKDEPAF